MRFGTPSISSSSNGRARRQSRILLALLVAGLLAFNLVVELFRPDVSQPKPVPGHSAAPVRPGALREGPETDVLPPGGFRSPASAQPEEEEGPGPKRNGARSASALLDVTRLSPELLAPIEDDRLHLRSGERESYYAALGQARDLPANRLEQSGLRDLSYLQLFNDPDLYRGQPVTLEGELRQLTAYPAGENSHGINTIYEAWFFNRDSGDDPYVFHCTSIPDGVPQGKKLHERIRVTGYFFKRYQYATERGLHSAPMLLGKRLRWIPAPTRPQTNPELIPYILGGLALVGTAMGVVVCWFAAGDSRRRRRRHAPAHPGADSLSGLRDLDTPDIGTQLQRLADQEREGQ